jgi:hypothetical protein
LIQNDLNSFFTFFLGGSAFALDQQVLRGFAEKGGKGNEE